MGIRKLAQIMFDFSQLSRRQRIIMRNRTERLSDLLDWKKLATYYTESRYQALYQVFPEHYPMYESSISIRDLLHLFHLTAGERKMVIQMKLTMRKWRMVQ